MTSSRKERHDEHKAERAEKRAEHTEDHAFKVVGKEDEREMHTVEQVGEHDGHEDRHAEHRLEHEEEHKDKALKPRPWRKKQKPRKTRYASKRSTVLNSTNDSSLKQ